MLGTLKEMWDEISKKIEGIHFNYYIRRDCSRGSSDAGWLQKIEGDKKRMEDWMARAGNVSLTGRFKKKSILAVTNAFF